MKWILSILALVFAVEIHAQPSPINRRAMVISGLARSQVADPTNFPVLQDRMWIRLRSNQQPLTNKVASWVDEIQAKQFNQGDTTKQPTNAYPTGLFFDGANDYFTNTTLTIPSGNVAVFLVLKLLTAGTAFGGVILHDPNHSVNTDGIYLGGANSDLLTRGINSVAAQFTDRLGQTYFGDILLGGDNSTGDYTNNISTTHNIGVLGGSTQIDIIGDGSSHNAKYKGYMMEIIIWTNIVALNWDSTVRSNLHYYATNTYTITP